MEDEFSRIMSLIGDPIRSKIMWALLDGKAYTATELAHYTGTTAPNISMHLQKLLVSELLSVEKQGRHKYYTYSRPEISFAIESLANLIPQTDQSVKTTSRDQPVKFCRTCYDHLAGKVGVLLADTMIGRGYLLREGSNFRVSEQGGVFFGSLGINTSQLNSQKRAFSRVCLDWSERRPHVGGALGAALLDVMLKTDWLRRTSNSRAIVITGKGRISLREKFSLDL